MKRVMALLAFVLLVFPTLAAEDFTGKWSGAFSITRPDGSVSEEGIYLDLKHKGAELTGTAGPTADEQWPILKGAVKEIQ